MAKARNPETFAECFSVDPAHLEHIGILNPTLAIDTKLFIDPLLLQSSEHPEIRESAVAEYHSHFGTVIKFLLKTTSPNDVAERTARKLLHFPEVSGTCLGYGAGTISGSGFGAELSNRVFEVGREIVGLGITDPDLFPAMALFEADIGADRVSDMTTNVISKSLLELNTRVLAELGLQGNAEEFRIGAATGLLLVNPLQSRRTPVILIPRDILRKLPIACDWDSVATAAAENEELRARVNEHVAHIWVATTKREKGRLRSEALKSQAAFEALLESLHRVPRHAYDASTDPDGLLSWPEMGRQSAEEYPLELPATPKDCADPAAHICQVVATIIEQFRFLIEHRGLNKVLYAQDGKPRHESVSQLVFFTAAYCYCKANDIDISPEIDTGTGKVDFKFSHGFNLRVLVEIKLSTNQKLVPGLEKQLETYKTSEETAHAFYLVLDVGGMGKKDEKVIAAKNAAAKRSDPVSNVEFVDAKRQPSASKR